VILPSNSAFFWLEALHPMSLAAYGVAAKEGASLNGFFILCPQ
jgi:hypothetical protein